MSSIELEWSIEMGISEEVGIKAQVSELIEALCKIQYSLKVKFGGKMVNTEQLQWNTTTEEDETVKLKIPPNTKLYVWQFQMGFGKKKNLFSRDTAITYGKAPPEETLEYFMH